MIVTVDPGSAVPPYEQLRVQLATRIRTGALTAGTQLPPIRQLARDLGIASGTVARAYTELERDGLVLARGRHGTVVANGSSTSTAAVDERHRRLAEAAAGFATEVQRLGVAPADALAAVRAALQ